MNRVKMIALGLTLTAGTIVTSCSTPAEKVEKEQTNVENAEDDLIEANKEYFEEIEEYKREKSEKIAANDKTIMEFKARIDAQKKEAKNDYVKKITELENKNSDLKMKMENYKEDGKANWEKFQNEFNKEMEDLGNSFNEIGNGTNKK